MVRFIAVAFLMAAQVGMAYTGFTGYSGSPVSSGSCAVSCHGPANSFTPTVSGWPPAAEPGQAYTVTVSHAGNTLSNFNASVLDLDNNMAGTLVGGSNTETYAHSGEGIGIHGSVTNQTSYSFYWIAPQVDIPMVTLYVAVHETPGAGDPNGFGAFGSTVPIELTSFAASFVEGGIILSWSTLSEQDNYGFMIYRSEGDDFQPILDAMIPGAGNSTNRQDYSYLDESGERGRTYWYKLEDISNDGTSTMHGPISATPGQGGTAMPDVGVLSLAYPNPMSTETTISYRLHEASPVKLAIYDLSGHEIRLLVSDVREPGHYTVAWDGLDDKGRPVLSGIYLYRFGVRDGATHTGNAVLIR